MVSPQLLLKLVLKPKSPNSQSDVLSLYYATYILLSIQQVFIYAKYWPKNRTTEMRNTIRVLKDLSI